MSKFKNPTANDVLRAYRNADNKGKQILKDLYGEDVCNVEITELVKSFEDACEILGIDTTLPDVSVLPEKDRRSIIAFYKLTIITRALNEGWEPNWEDGSEWKYFPWFDMRVLARSYFSTPTGGGVACAGAAYVSTVASALIASRLAFKTRALAKYCGITFEKLWAEYMVIEK